MEFYVCEIEHENGIIQVALSKSEIVGISDKFLPGPVEKGVLGFSLYGGYLYPVVTHSNIVGPIFKYFLIFPRFAFGVTRVVQEIQGKPTPLSPDIDLNSNEFEKLSEYTGAVIIEDKPYYVYNIYNVHLPVDAKVQKREERVEAIKKDAMEEFIVIGDAYALTKGSVKAILSSEFVTKFKVDNYDGFIDYGKIIPVVNLDDGNHVVVLENIAYRTSKVLQMFGKILIQETTKEKYLETAEGTYKILV
ncbi:MAG TPA: hypothetical protein PK258_06445 [Fervidobacterium sp.]|nr:hypothetical protein [Fervidobacterium sp.]HPC79884.1 hypothetical protein [Fervidobacterium sp.]HQG01230.1 hypothetical protein [Fervidobacterium sp.]HQI08797.1 hypothetical protein [Fervidobacterium sp.]HQI93032.1 hypothetical protein [Fervidobacterium sp.]